MKVKVDVWRCQQGLRTGGLETVNKEVSVSIQRNKSTIRKELANLIDFLLPCHYALCAVLHSTKSYSSEQLSHQMKSTQIVKKLVFVPFVP